MVEQISFNMLRVEGPIVPVKLATAHARARALLLRAEAEAAQIRESARGELEAARSEAEAEVRQEGARRLKRRLRRLARVDHLRRVRLCEASVEACLAVAEKVWAQVPVDRGPVIRAMAREMVALAPPGRTLELQLHPDDVGLVPDGVAVVASDALDPGDAIGRFEGGGLDGRTRTRADLALEGLATQLERVRAEQDL